MSASWQNKLIVFFSILLGLFTFYTAGFGVMVPPVQRGVHVGLIIPLIFLLRKSKICRGFAEDVLNITLIVLSLASFGYYILNWERLYTAPVLSTVDLLMGLVGIVLVLEATRRVVGIVITGLIVMFIAYALFGRYIPFNMLQHQGFTLEQIVELVFYGTEGIFSTPVAVCSTFVVMIVIFGGYLNVSGAADFFMNLAKSVAGTTRGGPAKIAVIASGLMGMITGATVANVATVGSVTIPMMKKMGYKGYYAGAVEALSSTGSQLMPPIMGAAVFIMVEFVMVPYFTICINALFPAVLYYLSVFLMVHFHSLKLGLEGIPRSECPSFFGEIKKDGYMLLPIVLLVYLLSRWMDPMFAVFLAIVSLILLSWVRKATRIGPKQFFDGMERGARSMAPLTIICAGSGIIIGIMSMTGLGMRIAFLIEMLSHGYIFIALVLTAIVCIILGMGLPTVAAYVVLAVIVPPALKKMGVDPLQSHLFIFYFAILSGITPPVCTGAYTAAGIAEADPMETAFQCMRLGIVTCLLPFVFVYDPAILLKGTLPDIVMAIGFTGLGIMFWAAAIETYFFTGRLTQYQRLGMGVASLCLMVPVWYFRIAGLALGVVMIVLNRSTLKNQAAMLNSAGEGNKVAATE